MTRAYYALIARFTPSNVWRWITMVIAAFLTYSASISVYSPAPIEPADVVIFVEHPNNDTALLVEVRSIVGLQEGESIYMSRKLYRESNPADMLMLESGNFRTPSGVFPLVNTTALPNWVTGRWCSAVTYSWWPAWSQREFSLGAKDVCFETTEYE